MRRELKKAQSTWRKTNRASADDICSRFLDETTDPLTGYERLRMLYAICRKFNPETVVETGVQYGISSSYILQALEDNGHGRLYSIDLPNVAYQLGLKSTLSGVDHQADLLGPGRYTGDHIPGELKQRWTLKLGDSREELPHLLGNLETVDMFHHDSMHTYEHMTFEYETVWPKLSKGGVTASDDVLWNDAFKDFCRSRNVAPHIFGNWGFAIKKE